MRKKQSKQKGCLFVYNPESNSTGVNGYITSTDSSLQIPQGRFPTPTITNNSFLIQCQSQAPFLLCQTNTNQGNVEKMCESLVPNLILLLSRLQRPDIADSNIRKTHASI